MFSGIIYESHPVPDDRKERGRLHMKARRQKGLSFLAMVGLVIGGVIVRQEMPVIGWMIIGIAVFFCMAWLQAGAFLKKMRDIG